MCWRGRRMLWTNQKAAWPIRWPQWKGDLRVTRSPGKAKQKKNKKKGERNEKKKNSGLAQEMAPTPQTGGAEVIQRVVLLGNRWRRRFAPLQLGQVPLEIHLGQL